MNDLPKKIWLQINENDAKIGSFLNFDSINLTCHEIKWFENDIPYILKSDVDKKMKKMKARIKLLENILSGD
ncbi:MAG: hypothetical protein HGB12_14105 [Bacteroidetes bacterium]|nr:hypothetical protein [Bacteroidota bacterium]